MSSEVAAVMGRVGLPAPVAELASRDWDAVVVGGGHNGLAAAAYLAREGRSVLVLERRDQLGGACTLERPFADDRYVISPCAYVVGLLDPIVVSELELERRGYRVTPADPNLWCPFGDGSSYAAFVDSARTAEYLRAQGFADRDIEGLARFGGCSTAPAIGCEAAPRATRGSSRRRAGPRSSRGSTTTSSWASCSRTRSPICSSATSTIGG